MIELLDVFDREASRALETPLAEGVGLPASAEPALRLAVEVALTGARKGVAGWRPLPPLAPDEEPALASAIAALVASAVEVACAPLLSEQSRAAQRARADLLSWNRERRATQLADLPTPEALAAMRDRGDLDRMEREDLPDGRFRLRYRLRDGGEG